MAGLKQRQSCGWQQVERCNKVKRCRCKYTFHGREDAQNDSECFTISAAQTACGLQRITMASCDPDAKLIQRMRHADDVKFIDLPLIIAQKRVLLVTSALLGWSPP